MTDFTPSDHQNEAIRTVMQWLKNGTRRKPFFYLGGYAGSGKSSLAQVIAEQVNGHVQYCAYTGKASLVMRSKGCEGASTIHSLIYKPEEDKKGAVTFVLNEYSELRHSKLIIADECSMIAEDLALDLLSFDVPILVLGDPAQLPPVNGEGYFTKGEPDFMLTEIHRQAQDNPIILLSMLVRQGETLPLGDYGAAKIIRYEDVADNNVELDTFDQIICGKNVTRNGINQSYREMKGAEGDFPVEGEKLVCLRNDKQIGLLNGGLWKVEKVNKVYTKAGSFTVSSLDDLESKTQPKVYVHKAFFDGTEASLTWQDRKKYSEFTYGYALTAHKCVHPDTLVETEQGLLPIRLIAKEGMVATPFGTKPYLNKVRNVEQNVRKITCEDGYSVTVSTDHHVEVIVDGNTVMKDASEVSVGDWMRVKLGETVSPSKPFVDNDGTVYGEFVARMMALGRRPLVEVPIGILRSPLRVQRSFLIGLFGYDPQGKPNKTVSSNSERLIRTAQTMLLRLNVPSTIKENAGWTLTAKPETNDEWHYVRITNIEETRSETMCVEVPDGHRFNQNGFPHGNCQGSQFDNVLLFDESSVFREHRSKWLYTSVTRAAKTITIIVD